MSRTSGILLELLTSAPCKEDRLNIYGGRPMPMREKDRNLRRRRRRVLKLRRLKALLADAKDLKTRQRLIAKIQKIDPWHEIPEAE